MISPESFQTIDVISLSVTVLFLPMINETMNISSRSNSGIRFPGIRTNRRPDWNLTWDKRLKCISFNTFDNFRPDLAAPAKDPKHRLFLRTSSSLWTMIANRFPFVFPCPPRYVSATSTIPKKVSGTSFARTIRILVNALNTRRLSNPVRSIIEFELCSMRNR